VRQANELEVARKRQFFERESTMANQARLSVTTSLESSNARRKRRRKSVNSKKRRSLPSITMPT